MRSHIEVLYNSDMTFSDQEPVVSPEPELHSAQSLTDALNHGPFHMVSLHVGDASLSAALQGIGAGDDAAVVVDPSAEVPELIFGELKGEEPLTRMIDKQGGGNAFYSVHAAAQSNAVREGLNAYYASLWQEIIRQRRSGKIYAVPQTFEQVLAEVMPSNKLRGVCDEITCYYPPPRDFRMFPLRALAALTLKQNGRLRIVTEDAGVCLEAQHRPWYVDSSMEMKEELSVRDFPVSPYDFVYGKNGRFVVELTNTQGMLTKNFQDLLRSRWKYVMYNFLNL